MYPENLFIIMTGNTITLYTGQAGMYTAPSLRYDVLFFFLMRNILKDKTYFCIVSVNSFLNTSVLSSPLCFCPTILKD